MRDDETVTVEFDEVVAVTEKAVLLSVEGSEVWFPKSLCPELDDLERGDTGGEFECPRWLAEEKGVA